MRGLDVNREMGHYSRPISPAYYAHGVGFPKKALQVSIRALNSVQLEGFIGTSL